MPELPEVETIRAQLDPMLRDVEIVGAWAFPSAKFDEAPAAVGATVATVRRRGKYLLIDLDHVDGPLELVIHLGMTGRLSVVDGPGPAGGTRPHLRARWDLHDGRVLCFDDIRRFGRLAVVGRGEHDRLPTLAALGPEPFDDAFSPELVRTYVAQRSRALKTHLLSQRLVAGVGNIYADEALWRAEVHPATRRISRAASIRLRDAVREVLQAAIDHRGTTLRDYRDAAGSSGENQFHLDCYGRSGQPCLRCGRPLRRVVIDARSTTYCPGCQRR